MQSTLKNRTIFCRDNLDVLHGIDSSVIDLIYLDPPFNTKKQFTAHKNSSAEGASFKDYWSLKDIKDEWTEILEKHHPQVAKFLSTTDVIGHKSNKNYLTYMSIRLIEMQRVLKDTGSVYLHCDPTMSHYLKLLMDGIFGHQNFRNEVVWYYNSGARGRRFGKRHDIILLYSKTEDYVFKIDDVRVPYSPNIHIPASKAHYYHPRGKVCDDVWQIPIIAQNNQIERTGYPTQKPLALLDRIIRASSNEQDIVLDPFCGCATTCIAAERLNRQWIGIDVSKKSFDLAQSRLHQEAKLGHLPTLKKANTFSKSLLYREDIPTRTDLNT